MRHHHLSELARYRQTVGTHRAHSPWRGASAPSAPPDGRRQLWAIVLSGVLLLSALQPAESAHFPTPRRSRGDRATPFESDVADNPRREPFKRAFAKVKAAKAHLLPHAVSTTTVPPPKDDVKIEKLHFPCVDERAHMSLAKILRQIGRTLQRPLTEMVTETQVVYFYYLLGRCPSPAEGERISHIFTGFDMVIGMLIASIPGAKAPYLVQTFGGPLLQMIADNLDGLAPNPDELNAANENLAFLARSMIATAPRDRAGNVIKKKLVPPRRTTFDRAGATIKLDGEDWRLSLQDGRFIATRNSRTGEVEYSRETAGWRWRNDGLDGPDITRVQPLSRSRAEIDRRLLQRLGVAASERLVVPHVGGGTLQQVRLMGTDHTVLCAKIDTFYVPVRQQPDGASYEAYDLIQPGKPGYPLRVDDEGRWMFSGLDQLQAKRRGQSTGAPSHVSDKLYRTIPRSWRAADVDPTQLSAPDNRGVVSSHGQRYVLLDDGAVPIEGHKRHAHIFLLGPSGSEKVLCHYDHGKRQFVLMPEESAYIESDFRHTPHVLTNMAMTQERIATQFARQRIQKNYRDGFRTLDRKAFPAVVLADTTLKDAAKEIYCYGLDAGELRAAGKYSPAALEIKATVEDSARRLQALTFALRDPARSERLFSRFAELVGGAPGAQVGTAIKRYFLHRVDGTASVIAAHMRDDCRRIWLAHFRDDDIYGTTLKSDPLKRIFINIEQSGAYRSDQVRCGMHCYLDAHNDDLLTVVHEASHLGADTEDVFYMHTPQGSRPLRAEVRRLLKNRLNIVQAKYLLRLARREVGHKQPDSVIIDTASEIFRTQPDIRAQLLIDNADSFAQLILELSDEGMGRRKRDGTSSPGGPHALLSAIAAQALWRVSSGRSESSIHAVPPHRRIAVTG